MRRRRRRRRCLTLRRFRADGRHHVRGRQRHRGVWLCGKHLRVDHLEKMRGYFDLLQIHLEYLLYLRLWCGVLPPYATMKKSQSRMLNVLAIATVGGGFLETLGDELSVEVEKLRVVVAVAAAVVVAVVKS